MNFPLKTLFMGCCLFLISCAYSGSGGVVVKKNSSISASAYKIAVFPFSYKYHRPDSQVFEYDIAINAGELAAKSIEKRILEVDKYDLIGKKIIVNPMGDVPVLVL